MSLNVAMEIRAGELENDFCRVRRGDQQNRRRIPSYDLRSAGITTSARSATAERSGIIAGRRVEFVPIFPINIQNSSGTVRSTARIRACATSAS